MGGGRTRILAGQAGTGPHASRLAEVRNESCNLKPLHPLPHRTVDPRRKPKRFRTPWKFPIPVMNRILGVDLMSYATLTIFTETTRPQVGICQGSRITKLAETSSGKFQTSPIILRAEGPTATSHE